MSATDVPAEVIAEEEVEPQPAIPSETTTPYSIFDKKQKPLIITLITIAATCAWILAASVDGADLF